MSISEARRQMLLLEKLAEEYKGNGTIQAMYLATNALVETIAENKPYDGSLNTIRVPTAVLFQLTFDLKQNDLEDIGLEDLLVTLRARLRKSPVDSQK
jgi:hypothetical protein